MPGLWDLQYAMQGALERGPPASPTTIVQLNDIIPLFLDGLGAGLALARRGALRGA